MGHQEHALHWIDSAGGPLILISGEYLPAWRGYDPDDAEGETDYERACAVADYLGLVGVGGGQGLVLGDEPLMTAWWPLSPCEGVLVRWVFAEGQASVIHALSRLEEEIWQPGGITFAVGTRPLHLFDAALAGTEVGEHLVIRLEKGRYAVDTGIARPDAQTELLLHRLRRV